MSFRTTTSLLVAIALAIGICQTGAAQLEFEQPPINYETAPTQDAVIALQQQLDAGEQSLAFETDHGYLPAVLELLGIDPSSQVLVHSKTSLQLHRISPRRPRALYFNDESYVGWVQGGDIEIMTTAPRQGAIFYTLANEQSARPQFLRDQGQCLTCHASSKTQDVPGGLVRSVFVDRQGQPQLGSGTFTIGHHSPFENRWGGYFVTGTHGTMRHMGNVMLERRQSAQTLDREAAANLTSLEGLVDTGPYLSPHSDIVALMVLEHQTQMQNYITRANFECRAAVHYDGIMNAALDRPDDFVSDSTKRRIMSAGDKLLRYLLFADEFPLTSPVQGTSEFAKQFEEQGPRDKQGRSLRDFDLETRMFKYPCSYLIGSAAFKNLPPPVKEYVVGRLHAILTGRDDSDEFTHLSRTDRAAILEILSCTMPELGITPASGGRSNGNLPGAE